MKTYCKSESIAANLYQEHEILRRISCGPPMLSFCKKNNWNPDTMEQQPRETRSDIMEYWRDRGRLGSGVGLHPETPSRLIWTFKGVHLKWQHRRDKHSAGHLLCNAATVQEKMRYFCTIIPGETGPGCYYKSQFPFVPLKCGVSADTKTQFVLLSTHWDLCLEAA